ncbi:MAG TPA: Asp23/Gls24 family envelope stress response protein [Pseudonocardiaceae bacterium]|jgi:uncharacterized alkaline shock family protein YloU|nr:Asp23/Gls24 family envelope stress response protein [Pseudonocardiaceae bacterium]
MTSGPTIASGPADSTTSAEAGATGTRPGDPAERGTTTIAQRTVERLAMHAVSEVEDVGGAAKRVFGVALAAEDLDNAAKVTANVIGERATLDVRISVVYPASVAATTENVRTRLTERIEEFTGLRVRRVNITVTALHSPLTTRTGRVR